MYLSAKLSRDPPGDESKGTSNLDCVLQVFATAAFPMPTPGFPEVNWNPIWPENPMYYIVLSVLVDGAICSEAQWLVFVAMAENSCSSLLSSQAFKSLLKAC